MTWARAGYGLLLLAVPGPLLRLASGRSPSTRLQAVARILGARQLIQAAVIAVGPDAACLAVSAEADLVHVASMLAWSAFRSPSRRLALLSGAVAGLFAAADIAGVRRAQALPFMRVQAGDPLAKLVRIRDRAAASVARRTLPARWAPT
jgi:hypothetical protein